jgi:hypothetical protein
MLIIYLNEFFIDIEFKMLKFRNNNINKTKINIIKSNKYHDNEINQFFLVYCMII